MADKGPDRDRGCMHLRAGGFLIALSIAVGALLLSGTRVDTVAPKFYDDDPIAREPETRDASGVQPWDIPLAFDLGLNLFARPGDRSDIRAQNVNTIDEVPDSSWFTNRILARTVSIDEAVRGPNTIDGPAPGKWTVITAKTAGAAPGFTIRDRDGVVWFVSFDGAGHRDAATGAIAVATRLFWALGYYQVEAYLTTLAVENLELGESAQVTPPSGRRRQMRVSDLEDVAARADREADGRYRILASRAVPGKPLGGFRYHGTRPDDPNDVVPHEHRRELRALKVFGAWTNLVDMKAGNTLDSLIQENGRSVVRHYLQDVGSTFGTGALAPREWDEGYEYLFEGNKVWKRFYTLNFSLSPWQTVPYEEYAAIGRFEGDEFKPEEWKSRVPAAAVLRARADDNFWAARRVMAFSDELIRAIVKTGQYHDSAAERHLAEVLIKRRDAIGRAYFTAINPLVDFTLDGGALRFENAAVKAALAPAPSGGYRVAWFSFDNATGQTQPLGAPQTAAGSPVQAPPGVVSSNGAFIQAQIAAVDPPHPAWAAPVHVTFRRVSGAWKLVGVERVP